jgi:hypothetical protein
MSKRLQHLNEATKAEQIFADNYEVFAELFNKLKLALEKEFMPA